MCPDWELNWQPFGLWNDTQHTDTATPVRATANQYYNPILFDVHSALSEVDSTGIIIGPTLQTKWFFFL